MVGKGKGGVMDIQNLASASMVVIHSLLAMLKDNNIDVNSAVMRLSSASGEAVSPEVNLGELTQQTLDELQKAKTQKLTVPKGFVLVPREPTDEMIMAGYQSKDKTNNLRVNYQAMIEAQEQVG
ncbi:hypothetical protein [Acinetobacter sp. ANC 4558]|uniref:hypothetical protein n=1 Tax=Acinetobacter sp. ANC 4558 TaxID=1977876 RepID=UPI00111C7B3E|nr:hypothetical protein [Acinetobacter sp. ANC 4558]